MTDNRTPLEPEQGRRNVAGIAKLSCDGQHMRCWSEYTATAIDNVYRWREKQIHLVLRPRPKWMPQWLWKRLVKTMLTLECEPWRDMQPK